MLMLCIPSRSVVNIFYSVSLNMLTLLLTLSQDGWAPFHAACQEGHYQVAELLLQTGASVDQKTKVRCSVGQDCVCDTEQCTYITRFLPFVYIVL